MDLVEREAVLQTLQERLRDAASFGHVALVAGEAGVGKTSVLSVQRATTTSARYSPGSGSTRAWPRSRPHNATA